MEHAKPGDIIKVLYNDPNWLDKQLVVIPCPEELININKPGDAWFISSDHGGHPMYFSPKHYMIIKRTSMMDHSADEFLKQQLNDNLRSVFV